MHGVPSGAHRCSRTACPPCRHSLTRGAPLRRQIPRPPATGDSRRARDSTSLYAYWLSSLCSLFYNLDHSLIPSLKSLRNFGTLYLSSAGSGREPQGEWSPAGVHCDPAEPTPSCAALIPRASRSTRASRWRATLLEYHGIPLTNLSSPFDRLTV